MLIKQGVKLSKAGGILKVQALLTAGTCPLAAAVDLDNAEGPSPFREQDTGSNCVLLQLQVSPDGGLLQSSTVADPVRITFADGSTGKVSGSYLEFAQRLVLPEFHHLEVGL